MLRGFALLLCAYGAVGYGYDSGGGDQASCGRPYRTGRNYRPPCDVLKHGYCVQAGQLYPWKAVRKFVKDNQGLMRRMYGDQRQAHLLRTELDADILDEEWGQATRDFNEWRKREPLTKRYSRHQHDPVEDDLDIDNELSPIPDDENPYGDDNPYSEPRYLRDDPNSVVDVLKTKFIYSQHEPAVVIKLAGLKTASRYRATTQRTTTTTPKTPTTEKTTKTTTSKSITTKASTPKPNLTSRTLPPRNTNLKNIYSARNTASTSSTTRKSTTVRPTTVKSTTTTSPKSQEKETTKQPVLPMNKTATTAKSKFEVESTTVSITTKKVVYITRDSGSTSKKNDGVTEMLDNITTESTLVTSSSTGSTTTEDYLNESTTDTTASADQASATTKNQIPTTTIRDKLLDEIINQPNDNIVIADKRIGEGDDTIEILSGEQISSEKFVPDKHNESVKSEPETLKLTLNVSDQKITDNDDSLSEEDVEYDDNNEENDDDSISEQDTADAEVSASETHVHKVNTPKDTMLFQDMEDDTNKKVTVNNNMKGVNACPVKEEVVAPFWANNTRGEVLALLNMYPFEQYVHWEKCTYEHRQMYCREGCRCEQQYRLHRLLAYDPNNECRGIFSDWFRFPSCCVCKCYNIPAEFRVTSRSPRLQRTFEERDSEYDDNVT